MSHCPALLRTLPIGAGSASKIICAGRLSPISIYLHPVFQPQLEAGCESWCRCLRECLGCHTDETPEVAIAMRLIKLRSVERRVGNEGVERCIFRWGT